MPDLDPDETSRQLTTKFRFEDRGGTGHALHVLVVDDEIVAQVGLSRGTAAYRKVLIGRMASQLGVGPNKLVGMIRCSVSRDAFLELKGIQAALPEATAATPELAPGGAQEVRPRRHGRGPVWET